MFIWVILREGFNDLILPYGFIPSFNLLQGLSLAKHIEAYSSSWERDGGGWLKFQPSTMSRLGIQVVVDDMWCWLLRPILVLNKPICSAG